MADAKLKKEIAGSRFKSALIEAENRAEATAILIRKGFRVYHPEADYEGEDLLVRKPDGVCVAVQLKSRLRVDKKRYGGGEIWMLFPSRPYVTDRPRDWYLIPHKLLFEKMGRCMDRPPDGRSIKIGAPAWCLRKCCRFWSPTKSVRQLFQTDPLPTPDSRLSGGLSYGLLVARG